MLNDTQLIYDSNASMIGVNATIASQQVIDYMGVGVGNAPPNYFGVQSSVFGQDVGIGDGASPPVLTVIVGAAFVGAGATLRVQFQEAVDSGTPSYQPGTWVTVLQTGDIAVANLTAGAQIAEMTIPPRAPGQAMPRYSRLVYVGVGTFTAGTISLAEINTGRNDDTKAIYPSGF